MCRTCSGTFRDVTTVDVTTGSVGESTAASRKASAQLNSTNRSFAARASRTIVRGIASARARAAGLQCTISSSRSTKSPSEKSVTIRASSTSWITVLSPGSIWITSAAARPSPTATDRTAIESTVPRNRPESAAATASTPPP